MSKFTKSVGCRAVIRTCASWLLAQCSFYCMYILGVGPCQVFHRQIIVHEIQCPPFFGWEKKDMFLFLMLRVVIGKIKEGLSAGVREREFLETCQQEQDWFILTPPGRTGKAEAGPLPGTRYGFLEVQNCSYVLCKVIRQDASTKTLWIHVLLL